MTAYVALLRAVNVGGNAKLPMSDLKRICEEAGFAGVRTYIASGNVVFASELAAAQVARALEERLAGRAAYPIRVFVRTAAELAAVVAAQPFPDAPPNRVMVTFLDGPAAGALDAVTGRKREQLQLGGREIYVHYTDGMADSTLAIPAARQGTARNLNTLSKLAAMAAQL